MLGLFKSKEMRQKKEKVHQIGKELFQQIGFAREKVKNGVISVQEFDGRLNSMFTAGYLIGYVDDHLTKLFEDEKSKGKHAAKIYEGIFPGYGVNFIKSRLTARRVGATISPDNIKYIEVVSQCQEFDLGISAARLEVSLAETEYPYKPSKLYHYLLGQSIE